MDLEDVGRPQDEVEALEAGQAAGVVHQNDVVSDSRQEMIKKIICYMVTIITLRLLLSISEQLYAVSK